MTDDKMKRTWGMGFICPICDMELVCEERECDRLMTMFVKKPTYKTVRCPRCGIVASDDPWMEDAEAYTRKADDVEIEANLLVKNRELVKEVVPMHDDEELGWIIDAMDKIHDTEFVHRVADLILLELLKKSHPKTVEAFKNLGKWYA